MGGKNKSAGGSKQWVHPSEALLKGHIVYNCKFLGNTEVDEPKGSHVVKDAITKMKFNKQIKRAEGQKPPKVELTVSVDGVTVQEPKYKVMQHRFPLHRISYCADDKSDKRMFTFIAKAEDTNKHHCFVFDSEKCAEEITLTIGQAFDLAYKKFLETSKGDIDQRKQYLLLQKKVQMLTQENLSLKARVADLERLIDPKILDEFDKSKANGNAVPKEEEAVVGRKLENLIFDDDTNFSSKVVDNQTNGNATNASVPVLAPPPPVPARSHQAPSQPSGPVDLFGATPFVPPTAGFQSQAQPPAPTSASNPFKPAAAAADPFGMPAFSPSAAADLDQQIRNVDRELMDLQTGFSQGLSFGDDFNLDDLDPLKK